MKARSRVPLALGAAAIFAVAAPAFGAPYAWLSGHALLGRESNIFLAPRGDETAATSLTTGLDAGVGFNTRVPFELEGTYDDVSFINHHKADYQEISLDGMVPLRLAPRRRLEMKAGYEEDRDSDGLTFHGGRAGAWLVAKTDRIDRAFAGARLEDRRYPGLSRADAVLVTSEAGVEKRVARQTRLGAGAGISVNDASGDEYSYTEPEIFFSFRQGLGKKDRFRLAWTVRFRHYDADDPVFLQRRRDTRSRFILEGEHDLSRLFAVRASLLSLTTSSNIAERSYRDLAVGAGIVFHWDSD